MGVEEQASPPWLPAEAPQHRGASRVASWEPRPRAPRRGEGARDWTLQGWKAIASPGWREGAGAGIPAGAT